ncbi:hypothetical protein J4467_03305 [Candidatus Woesearchaeota archaeon]|nr:hypothetical protein [Candidatus Woesearchaeota archaeon]
MMDLCVTGIIRLFFILIKFGWNHWGWTITILVGGFLLFKLAKAIGFKKIFGNLVELGLIEYVIFFPILIILLFMGLILGTWIASLWSGMGFCEIIEQMTTWFL